MKKKNKPKHSPRRILSFIPVKKHEMDNESKQIENVIIGSEVDNYVSKSNRTSNRRKEIYSKNL